MRWQIFPSSFSLVFEISLLKGDFLVPEGLKNLNALKCSKFEILFSLHIGCIKVGFGAATNLEGSYYIRVKKLVADVVFQGVNAFKSVRNDNFVAF